MRLGAKIFGTLAFLCLLFVGLGLLLPGTWEAEVQMVLPDSPAEVFPFFNDLGAWTAWSPMPEGGASTFGAPEGVGAGLRWNDPRYGSGEVRIVESIPGERVDYEVDIEGGALEIHGSISLESHEDGTLVRWRESGDFGRNPLLGYTARSMRESQGRAMEESLRTLSGILGPPSGP